MALEIAWHKLIVSLELLSKVTLLSSTLEDPSHGRQIHAKIVYDILEVNLILLWLNSVGLWWMHAELNIQKFENTSVGPFWIQASFHILHRVSSHNVVLKVSRPYFSVGCWVIYQTNLKKKISNKYYSPSTPNSRMSKHCMRRVHNSYCGLDCGTHV